MDRKASALAAPPNARGERVRLGATKACTAWLKRKFDQTFVPQLRLPLPLMAATWTGFVVVLVHLVLVASLNGGGGIWGDELSGYAVSLSEIDYHLVSWYDMFPQARVLLRNYVSPIMRFIIEVEQPLLTAWLCGAILCMFAFLRGQLELQLCKHLSKTV